MNFTTQITIPKNPNPIDYHSKIISLGSCFAENMGEKFVYFKFQNTVNPFGIIFNPVSIEKLIERVVNNQIFTEKDIFFHNERWHCFEVHSDLSNSNAQELLQKLNAILKETKQHITEVTHFIITYGTSWVYRNVESQEIVANCHKVPQKYFQKEILSIETIENSIKNTIALVQNINPKCHFIFTISPVRHLKDGFVENQLSKAHLISAIHKILNNPAGIPPSGARGLFPSYEIVMDELRDYRFYGQDMLHPNQVAIDYIWEKFRESTINENAFETMDEVEKIQKALAHKPFDVNSESHQKFILKLQNKMKVLQKEYPFINF